MALKLKANKTIPLVNFKREHEILALEIEHAMRDVLEHSDFILGRAVSDFESAFAEYLGAEHAIGVASGTDALHLILRACGIGAGDDVLVPTNSFIATALAVSHAGATPRFVDCDPQTATINIDAIKQAISPETKAIIPVHLYGQPADMDGVHDIALEHGLRVIEDAAQAHGAEYHNQKCGTMSLAAAFSFYPAKNLGAYGDGGAIVTSDEDLAREIRLLRNWGSSEKYTHSRIGFNSRLDSLQAAVLSVKLRYLDSWNTRRNELAQLYRDQFVDLRDHLQLLEVAPYTSKHAYHLFVVRVKRGLRDALLTWLRERGIDTGIHYPKPIHFQEPYEAESWAGSLKTSEDLAKEIISLPLSPFLEEEEVDFIASEVHRFFESTRGNT
jgi:dTDP-4-amino-4,6-dideoxygalactose transaminase